jgi:outer membrane protein OmpA-like peptidoglycan-associated protein
MVPVAQAQQTSQPNFYFGAEAGVNWLFNTTILGTPVYPQSGFAAGGKIGYDFVGPRLEVEGVYRNNQQQYVALPNSVNNQISQVAVMANLLYDFLPQATVTPYMGAGAGVAFVDGNYPLSSAQFAYQGIVGLGWNVDANFRANIDGRYYGTTNPSVGGTNWTNNNFTIMASLQFKFGDTAAAPPPPSPPAVAPPSFMVFFDWDRSNLSQQALTTIQQAADAFKAKGSARITATGHTDTTGPESYNMALSLRRANVVKDALVRDGVPAQAITVIGKGESQLLVPTGDNVREPQNRRVEIVIQ